MGRMLDTQCAKNKILEKKIFVKSIGSKTVSQNLCQNIVRVKFCNFHTMCVSYRIASRRKLCQHGPLDFLSRTQIMITHQKMWNRVWAKNDIKKTTVRSDRYVVQCS